MEIPQTSTTKYLKATELIYTVKHIQLETARRKNTQITKQLSWFIGSHGMWYKVLFEAPAAVMQRCQSTKYLNKY